MPKLLKPEPFAFQPGRPVTGRYVVEKRLGGGSEGEVYAIIERDTGIRRAAKFYFPTKDPRGKAAIVYARKLDALRHCPILLQYHHQTYAVHKGKRITVVVSELVDGMKLSDFLAAQPEKRLAPFEAMHVLHAMAVGIEPIHERGEYHGDIHDDNVLLRRRGIGFDLRLIDFYDLGAPSRRKVWKDVLNMVEVFHILIGGKAHYRHQPQVVKDIIRGLKDNLILERFASAGDLRKFLETASW